jgi:hypothetical protein
MIHDVRMPEDLRDLSNAIAGLINANERMRVNLEENVVVLKQALLRVHEGMALGDVLHFLPSQGQREVAYSVLSVLLDARRTLAATLVSSALDAGIPVDELAERLELTPGEVGTIGGIASPGAG